MPFWQIIYFYDYDELADHEMEEKQRVDNDEYEFQDQSTWHWECQRIGNKIEFILFFVAVDVLCLIFLIYDGF